MKIKLDCDTNRNEKQMMGYVLARIGRNPRALIQTKCLGGEYSTAEAILEDLAEAFNDPNKKAKARALYRNPHMNENERLKTFLSKFTAYAAQAGITVYATKREDLDKSHQALGGASPFHVRYGCEPRMSYD